MGSIAPGQYYLIAEANGGANGIALPAANVSGGINLSAANGKVALALATTTVTNITPGAAGVLDYVGYGSATTFTGSAAAPAGSNTTSVNKVDVTTADTNNAAPAFAAAVPTPVPEPSIYAAMTLGILSALAMLRFRRHRA